LAAVFKRSYHPTAKHCFIQSDPIDKRPQITRRGSLDRGKLLAKCNEVAGRILPSLLMGEDKPLPRQHPKLPI